VGALRQRLSWTDEGALHDGPRRYLMMRTDVLMGTLQRLPAPAQAAWLQAWAASTRHHGAASLEAYAADLTTGGGGADNAALIDSTVQAAADLGWGRWAIVADATAETTARTAAVTTPAATSTAPLCAPIAGIFSALASRLLQSPAEVLESCCAAMQHEAGGHCSFVARRLPP
jgi:uncharacterized protein